LVQCFEHLKPFDESEVLVVPMKAYDLVLGLAWVEARNPEIDWINGQLTAQRMPNGPQQAKIPEADRAIPLPKHGEENTNDEHLPVIQLLRAAAFGHITPSEEVVESFAILLGECEGSQGASL
jgi:hypothetical protein